MILIFYLGIFHYFKNTNYFFYSNVETLVNCNTQLLKDWETEKKNQNETQKSDIEILGEIFMKMVFLYYPSNNNYNSHLFLKCIRYIVLINLILC